VSQVASQGRPQTALFVVSQAATIVAKACTIEKGSVAVLSPVRVINLHPVMVSLENLGVGKLGCGQVRGRTAATMRRRPAEAAAGGSQTRLLLSENVCTSSCAV
jgi:hypothetical protein